MKHTIRCLFAIIAMGSLPAYAVTLDIDATGQLVGASGVVVNGSIFDVEFVEGACIGLFTGCDDPGDFPFSNSMDATAASQALLNQVFTGSFLTNASLTNGCNEPSICMVLTPFGLDSSPPPGSFVSVIALGIGQFGPFSFQIDFGPDSNTTAIPDLTYAQWTVAPVPIPAALPLFGSALAALAWFGRRKTKIGPSPQF